jgi:hypothetical protein
LDLDLPNFIVTPHIAWASQEAMQILADQLIDNVEAFVAGEPRNVVIENDLTVGPRWFAPCLELALLIPFTIDTAWVQKRARKASTDRQWPFCRRSRHRERGH